MLPMLLGLAAAFGLLFVAFRVLAAIGREQGRKGFDDSSNRVGRMLTGVAGALFGRNRH